MTNLVETQDITKTFAQSLVLVRLGFSRFGTEKTDKQKSKEFRAENHVTVENAARVVKKLMPNCKSIEAVKAHDTATANRLKRYGAPYSKGVYMIPATCFLEATSQLRKDIADREPLIRQCGEDYEMAKQAAKATLGDSYDDRDYPTTSEFLSSFSHDFDVMPVADPSQLNLAVLGEASEAIKAAVNDTYHEKIATLAPHIRTILIDPLSKLASACQRFLADPKKSRASDSLFENVHAAVTQAKGLNIFDDDQINNAVYQIGEVIPTHAGGVKDNPDRCQQLLDDCITIIKSLDGVPPVATMQPESPEPLPDSVMEEVKKWTNDSALDDQILEESSSCDPESNPEPNNDILAKIGWV